METGRLLQWAAALSLGTVIAHAIDTPDHLTEWWGYATFFVLVSALQFFLGVLLLLQPWRYDAEGRPREDPARYGRRFYKFGIVLSAAVIIFYIITRTVGLPFLGPDARVEPITPLSLVPPLENIPLLYCLIALVRRTGVQAASA